MSMYHNRRDCDFLAQESQHYHIRTRKRTAYKKYLKINMPQWMLFNTSLTAIHFIVCRMRVCMRLPRRFSVRKKLKN